MAPWILLALLVLGGWAAPVQRPSGFTLQGRITTDKMAAELRVVLENPKAGNAIVASVDADNDGTYEIHGLPSRAYRLVAYINGKKQDRRDVNILCRPNSIVSRDFHYGRSASTLMLHFPAEDPDFVDVAELQGNYPKDVLKDYEKAFQDHINGNAARAVERLEAIVARAPEFYGAHARLGVVYQQQGCFLDAEAEYLQASTLSARSLQPLLNLASVQIRAADLPDERDRMISRALDTLKKSLEIRPASALSYCLMGAAYAKIRSFDEAEKSLQKALELDDDLSATRLLLADVYLQQKNWEAATDNLRAYLDDFPFAPDRSVVRHMMEDAQRSARDSERQPAP
jgi:tetratricopeptide (TPR) repeat protein